MYFKLYLVICNLLISLIMVVFGIIFEKHTPKNINGLYGYRTTMSMKNKDTWEFAHQYCGKLWKKIGFIILIPSLLVTFVSFTMNDNMQSIVSVALVSIQTIILIVAIVPVEKELKKHFDENGNRK